MSKERARRRAERDAADASTETRDRAEATLAAGPSRHKTSPTARQRPANRSWWERWRHPHGRRRFSRRTRTQRATVVFAVVAVLALVWLVVDDWGVRIALSMLAFIATPALVTMVLGRSHR